MAKKKAVKKKQPRDDAAAAREIDAQVLAAEEELLAAREALEAAEERYVELRNQAEDDDDEFDEYSFGDVLDRGLDIVKKHPGLGVAAAAAVGFLLGRLFRRW